MNIFTEIIQNEHVAHVQDAFLYKNYLLLHMYVNGVGIKLLSIDYTQIMQDLSKLQCSSSWWMLTANGSKIFQMTSTTTSATVKTLRTLFVRQSITYEVVSNNGSLFISTDFKQLMTLNGIRHKQLKHPHRTTCAPMDKRETLYSI